MACAPWSEEAQIEVVTGRPVAIAVPDHRGGVVFQADAAPPVPIEWIPAIGDEPVVIVAEPDARWLGLEDVALIDGAPPSVYRVGRTLPNPCAPSDEECRWGYQVDYLVVRDLDTGEDRILGIIGTFESSGRRDDFGGRHAAVGATPYGEDFSCVGVLDASLILDGGADRYIGEGNEDQVTWLVNGDCDAEGGCAAPGSCTSTAQVAMDFDVERAVVGLSLDGQAVSPVLVDSDDSVIELDLDGLVRIWPPASGTE